MSLGKERRQKPRQLGLPLEGRGEAPKVQRSGEAGPATSGDERSGSDRLMERVVERSNARAALKRVRQNKGSPGSDGMTVEELPKYLAEHWEDLREQLLLPSSHHRVAKFWCLKRHGFPEKNFVANSSVLSA